MRRDQIKVPDTLSPYDDNEGEETCGSDQQVWNSVIAIRLRPWWLFRLLILNDLFWFDKLVEGT